MLDLIAYLQLPLRLACIEMVNSNIKKLNEIVEGVVD